MLMNFLKSLLRTAPAFLIACAVSLNSIASAGSSSNELKRALEEADPIGSERLRETVDESDLVSSWGPVFSKSCQSVPLAKWESVLERAFAQTYRCNKQVGLNQLRDAIKVMRRFRIVCEGLSKKGVGATSPLYHKEKGVFIWNIEDDKYEIKISDELFEKFRDGDAPVQEELTESFFHEALHQTASNLRDWHADEKEVARRFNNKSCKETVFTDRIYLLGAACFPDSLRGEELLSKECYSACPKAFMDEPEPDVIKYYPSKPPLRAKSVPAKAAKAYCERIEDIAK
jgi:hypothetical protein